jgi:hypothetical protein
LACRCPNVRMPLLLGILLAGVLIHDPWVSVLWEAVFGDQNMCAVVLDLQIGNFLRNEG